MRTLHHWPLHPGSRQCRIVLAEKRLAFEMIACKPWDEADPIHTLNPASLPPVLIEEDTRGPITLVEAPAILGYLEETFTEPVLLPKSPSDRAEVRRLMQWMDLKFDQEVNALLLAEKLEKRMSGDGAPDPANLRLARDYLRWHLDYFETLLGERDGLAGDRYTLADICAAAHLSVIDYLGDVPWDHVPQVKAWYERIKCRPAFRSLLEDRLPGVPAAKWYSDLDF
ncbi:FtsZ-binding protein FzlA [Woodsholea maritima]|uniref:FtsZ-binding protein FzlA n=1 Tax=Woodsholea maritima TaxID=240237 RepID=UPI000361AE38|nr:glutathione S-transferase family protein [Woodsholea maritima]